MNALILKEKYLSFSKNNRAEIESLASDDFIIKDVQIQSPNNPAKLLKCKLLTYTV